MEVWNGGYCTLAANRKKCTRSCCMGFWGRKTGSPDYLSNRLHTSGQLCQGKISEQQLFMALPERHCLSSIATGTCLFLLCSGTDGKDRLQSLSRQMDRSEL